MRAILPLRPALLPVRPLGCSIGLDPSIGPDRSSAVDRLIIRGHLDWPATWLFVILLLLLTAPLEAQAGGLPTDPLLRLETGMHTGPIRRIGVDQAGGLHTGPIRRIGVDQAGSAFNRAGPRARPGASASTRRGAC